MGEQSGGNEDCRTWGKPNDEAKIPKDEMTAMIWVKVPEGGDCAPSKRKVCRIRMRPADSEWAKVERGGSKGAVLEPADKAQVRVEEGMKIITIEPKRLRSVTFKDT